MFADYTVEKFIVDTDEVGTGTCPDKNRIKRTRVDAYQKSYHWWDGGWDKLKAGQTCHDDGTCDVYLYNGAINLSYDTMATYCPLIEG